MKLVNFPGLYGDAQAPFLQDFIHHEVLEVRSSLHNWKINEHLHTDLYQIFIVVFGGGLLISGNKKIALNAPCVLLMPNNTIHGFVFQANVQGEVFTFSAVFLEQVIKAKPNILSEWKRIRYYDCQEQSMAWEHFLNVKDRIIQELNAESTEKQAFLQCYFQLLVLHLYRIGLDAAPQTIQTSNRTLDYFFAFQNSIRQTLPQVKSIREYAQQLSITPIHLNRICRSVAQKSALEVVHSYRLEEAIFVGNSVFHF
jgi:AraC family transcriptional regulator, transcriptional activator of pobA